MEKEEGMREIKFRAWVPKAKKFFYWGLGDIEGNGSFFTGPPSDPSATHEQFIEHLDKNSYEIYEGDIVLGEGLVHSGYGRWEDEICLIEWDSEYSRFFAVSVLNSAVQSYGMDETNWRIIGNIHENPGLIIC